MATSNAHHYILHRDDLFAVCYLLRWCDFCFIPIETETKCHQIVKLLCFLPNFTSSTWMGHEAATSNWTKSDTWFQHYRTHIEFFCYCFWHCYRSLLFSHRFKFICKHISFYLRSLLMGMIALDRHAHNTMWIYCQVQWWIWCTLSTHICNNSKRCSIFRMLSSICWTNRWPVVRITGRGYLISTLLCFFSLHRRPAGWTTYSAKSHWYAESRKWYNLCRHVNVYCIYCVCTVQHTQALSIFADSGNISNLMAMTFSTLSFPFLRIWFFYVQPYVDTSEILEGGNVGNQRGSLGGRIWVRKT